MCIERNCVCVFCLGSNNKNRNCDEADNNLQFSSEHKMHNSNMNIGLLMHAINPNMPVRTIGFYLVYFFYTVYICINLVPFLWPLSIYTFFSLSVPLDSFNTIRKYNKNVFYFITFMSHIYSISLAFI